MATIHHLEDFRPNQSDRLARLERHQRVLYILIALLILCVVGLCALIFLRNDQTFDIIRTRGIVVTDASDKARILIGAPIPESSDRVRTDSNKVRKYWASNFEDQADQYMEWYSQYHHSVNGIVFLNQEGFDQIQIGEHLSDPNIGKRQAPLTGMIWNDPKGWERGGLGVSINDKGQSRSVVGVDDEFGEAVHIMASEDGTRGVIVNDTNGRLLLGTAPANSPWFKNATYFKGVKTFDPYGKLSFETPMDTTTRR
jgi:hypothetical protein